MFTIRFNRKLIIKFRTIDGGLYEIVISLGLLKAKNNELLYSVFNVIGIPEIVQRQKEKYHL